jgi:hypothetical protein
MKKTKQLHFLRIIQLIDCILQNIFLGKYRLARQEAWKLKGYIKGLEKKYKLEEK